MCRPHDRPSPIAAIVQADLHSDPHMAYASWTGSAGSTLNSDDSDCSCVPRIDVLDAYKSNQRRCWVPTGD